MPVSARNVLWILGLVLILAAAEYGLGIHSARPPHTVDAGARPDASRSDPRGDNGRDTSDLSSHYSR